MNVLGNLLMIYQRKNKESYSDIFKDAFKLFDLRVSFFCR